MKEVFFISVLATSIMLVFDNSLPIAVGITDPALINVSNRRQTYDVRKDLSTIADLTKTRDLEGLISFSEEIDARWKSDVHTWIKIRAKICDSLSSYDFDDERQYGLAVKLAIETLSDFDNLPLDIEYQLLGKLRSTSSYLAGLESAENWPSDRSKRLDLALRFWRRIDRALDRSFDPDDPANLPTGNVIVPRGAYPAGVNPEIIKEPRIREDYKKAIAKNVAKAERYNQQVALLKLHEMFPEFIKQILVEFYSRRPTDTQSLNRYLKAFRIDSEKRNEIFKAITKNLREQP